MTNQKYWNGVLVIAPADGRGGIASVVRLHTQTDAWKSMQCRLVSTYDDRSQWKKVITAIKAYVEVLPLLPRARIVHVHLAAKKSVLRKLPFIYAAKLLRKPLVIHVHAFSIQSLFDETPFSAGRRALRLADSVVALSESWRDAMNARDDDLDISVIANPVAVTSISERSRKPDTAIILFAGKLEVRKGYQDLLAAAASVLDRFPSAEFWFAGHGDLEQASAAAKKLGIERSVKFLGWVDAQSMASLYREVDIFCLPSYQEGLPMVVLEAMGNGLPVVCTKVGGLPDYIEDGQNGLYVAVGNSKSIADSILYLISHPVEAKMIGQRAAETIKNRCGLSFISKRLEILYEEILRKYEAKGLAVKPLPRG